MRKEYLCGEVTKVIEIESEAYEYTLGANKKISTRSNLYTPPSLSISWPVVT